MIIAKEDTGDKGEGREQNGEAFHIIEPIKVFAVWTTRCLKVKCYDQNKRGQDCLDVGTQSVRKNDHHSEYSLPEHNHRFPEDVPFAEGSINEASGVVDPAILVVSSDVFDNKECDSQGKSKGEDDEKWPGEESDQNRMGPSVASNAGVYGPVIRRAIYPNNRRIVDTDAVEDVDESLADRDVADVADGKGAKDTSL